VLKQFCLNWNWPGGGPPLPDCGIWLHSNLMSTCVVFQHEPGAMLNWIQMCVALLQTTAWPEGQNWPEMSRIVVQLPHGVAPAMVPGAKEPEVTGCGGGGGGGFD
jgi:hypothetical protein